MEDTGNNDSTRHCDGFATHGQGTVGTSRGGLFGGDESWFCTGEQCNAKFHKLAFLPKTMGSNEIPLHVSRAKFIKEMISEKEVIGFVGGNDTNSFSDNSISSPTQSDLATAKLSDENGEVRRPVTKKKKVGLVANAITNLGTKQVQSAAGIESAIGKMADAILKGGTQIPGSGDSSSDTRLQNLEHQFSGVQTTLNEILRRLNEK